MDFKDNFMRGVAAAKDVANQRVSIRTVLEKFSSDIAEASENKLLIFFVRKDSRRAVDLSDYLGDIVRSSNPMIELEMYVAPVGVDNGSECIAGIEISSVTGFPCFVEFDLDRYVVNDMGDLMATLNVMLGSPGVSQQMLNALSRCP